MESDYLLRCVRHEPISEFPSTGRIASSVTHYAEYESRETACSKARTRHEILSLGWGVFRNLLYGPAFLARLPG